MHPVGPSLREQTQLTAVRVRDQLARTGTVPPELIAYVRTEVLRRGGGVLTQEQAAHVVEDHIEAWAEVFLREDDNARDDSKAKRVARMRQRAADLERERRERAAHVPRVMMTKE